ncbi:MAG: NUDIX domain-containing protein [Anaerolineae bacterium]
MGHEDGPSNRSPGLGSYGVYGGEVVGKMAERVDTLARRSLYSGYLRLDEVRFRFQRHDGTMSEPVTRLVVDREDAAVVLPYDRERRMVVLVQQFRYPAHLRSGPGWLWEAIAGVVDAGRTPEEVARSEAREEAGYDLGTLQPIMTVYSSPGVCAERLHLFLAPIRQGARVDPGGGLASESEDLLVREFPLDEALTMLSDGRIGDAKTALIVQYLAMHWDELIG